MHKKNSTFWPTHLPRAVHRFQSSFLLPLKLRIWFFIEGLAKPFCIQDRFDIATCGHSQLEVSAKADNGEVYDRYLIFATLRLAVKALHTFWVVYLPKASLKSDILEARHRVRSFNLLGKLLKKAQQKIWTFDTFRFGQQTGASNNKVLWHGWLDLKACGGRNSFVHLVNSTVEIQPSVLA